MFCELNQFLNIPSKVIGGIQSSYESLTENQKSCLKRIGVLVAALLAASALYVGLVALLIGGLSIPGLLSIPAKSTVVLIGAQATIVTAGALALRLLYAFWQYRHAE